MMKENEIQEHNDAILSKLDLDTQLAAYRVEELVRGQRGNLFVELACLMLYLQRTAGRTFEREWILERIGKPDAVGEDADVATLDYRLTFPECDCLSEHWASLRLEHGQLSSFETWEKDSQPAPAR